MPAAPIWAGDRMTVEILRGEIAALPPCADAAALLPRAGEALTLACTDAALKSAWKVLRTVMDYGYEHPSPARVTLVCADEAVYRAYRFQWNMWFAERKPPHEDT